MAVTCFTGCASTIRDAAIGVVDHYVDQASTKMAEENKFPWDQVIYWGAGILGGGGVLGASPSMARGAKKILNGKKK